MKILLLILFPVFFTSASDELKNLTNEAQTSTSALKELCITYSGDWITKSYIDKISSTKSPFKAQKHPFQNILIDTSHIQGDLLGISIFTYGDTETPFISYFKKINDNEFAFSHARFEGGPAVISEISTSTYQKLIFSIKNDVKTITLVNSTSSVDFIRLPKTICTEHLCELDAYITQEILAGKYVLMNAKGKVLSENIEIFENGKITGFADFNQINLWHFFKELNGIFESDVVQVGKNSPNKLNYYQNDPKNVFYFSNNNSEYQWYVISVDLDNFSVEKKELKYILKKK